MVTSDYETLLTGYEPKEDLNLTNAEELDPRYTPVIPTGSTPWTTMLPSTIPTSTTTGLRNTLQLWSIETGKPVEMRSNNDQFFLCLKSAQNQFPLVTQPEMICQTGGSVQARNAEERDSSKAQIRTMLDEQRRTIIAECSEKVLHHELPRSSCRTRSQNSSRRVTATTTGFFVKFINKIL